MDSLERSNGFDDIIYYQDKFYAISYSCETVDYDIGPPALETELALPNLGLYIAHCKKYLVESDGELLLFARNLDIGAEEEEVPYITDGFQIFKLDTSRQSWSPVKRVGNRMLFLVHNCSLSLSISDFSGGKANHIYFIDDNTDVNCDDPWGGHDLGVFNIEDETFQPHFESDSKKIWPRPVWVTHMPQYKRATN